MGLFDKAISSGLRMAASPYLEDFGTLQEFHIDTGAKTASGEVLLKGDEQPVAFAIGQYELSEEEGEVYLTVRQVTCSREWIQKVVDRMGPEKKIKLPEAAAKALKMARMV